MENVMVETLDGDVYEYKNVSHWGWNADNGGRLLVTDKLKVGGKTIRRDVAFMASQIRCVSVTEEE